MPRFVFEFDVDFPIEPLAARTCRDVLLSDLDNEVYTDGPFGLPNAESVNNLRNQAYEKAVRLFYHIVSLRTAENSLAPISRLPNEIMSRIFWFCAPNESSLKSVNLLAFSQACTTWRRLALSDPSLWTEVDDRWPALTRLLLHRSQPMAVSFCFGYDRDGHWGDCVPERDRLRTLFHHYDRRNVDPELTSYLSGRFINLEKLDIKNPGRTQVADVHAPRLRYLLAHNFAPRDLCAVITENLTRLYLGFSDPPEMMDRAVPLYSLSDLLAALRSCPRLDYLNLERSLNPNAIHNRRQVDQQEIRLLHLQSMYLEEDALVIACLLPNLYTPACTTFDLQSHSDHSSVSQQLPTIVHRFLQHSGRTRESAHGASVAFGLYQYGLDFYFNIENRHHELGLDNDYHLNILLPHDQHRTRNSCRTLELLLQGEPKLFVCGSVEDTLINPSDLWATLATLPGLRELEVGLSGGSHLTGHIPCTPLLLALGVPGIPAAGTRPNKPFSALRELVLRHFDPSEIVHGQTMQAHLLEFQEQRQREGYPVDIQPPVEELAA